jgi:hypothetical protein
VPPPSRGAAASANLRGTVQTSELATRGLRSGVFSHSKLISVNRARRLHWMGRARHPNKHIEAAVTASPSGASTRRQTRSQVIRAFVPCGCGPRPAEGQTRRCASGSRGDGSFGQGRLLCTDGIACADREARISSRFENSPGTLKNSDRGLTPAPGNLGTPDR